MLRRAIWIDPITQEKSIFGHAYPPKAPVDVTFAGITAEVQMFKAAMWGSNDGSYFVNIRLKIESVPGDKVMVFPDGRRIVATAEWTAVFYWKPDLVIHGRDD